MSITPQNYERFLLQELPPHARDIAEFLFNGQPLVFFLKQQATPNPDDFLLDKYKVPHKFWPDIIDAALLAKLSSFEPNPNFERSQVTFLIKTATNLVGTPLNKFSLEEVIRHHHERMPRLCKWLMSMAKLLSKDT